MKFCFLTSYYPPFLNNFYLLFPDFKELSYDNMLELLLNQHFADTGAAHYYVKKTGNESFIIISNCESLQKRWALENNVLFSEANWEKEIAFAQIKYYKPDVFYIESIFSYFGEFLKEVKPHCKVIAAWISTPFSENLPLNNIDVIFSSTPDFVKLFNDKGIPAYYLLPGFDIRVLEKISNPQPKTISLSFVGGYSGVHVNRKLLLNGFVSETPLQIWGYGYDSKPYYSKRTLNFYKHYFFPENRHIIKRFKKEVWGLEMYDIIQKSLITLNIHEALLKGNVGNMRMFEASGVGTMLLNDYGNNLSQLFEIDKEIIAYKNIPEAIEKYNYLACHPEKAIEIGLNAQKRTLKDYTYEVHISKLLDYLKMVI